jgi:DNA-binding MarR family transcriptional regulator
MVPERSRRAALPLEKADYVALARFRGALRGFLRFTESAARAAGLTPQQHQLLLAVRGRPGKDWATVGELALELQVRPHTAVGLIDRAAALGLVLRAAAPEDRRRVRVALTRRGRDTLERLTQRNRRELRGLRRALDLTRL